MVNVAIRCETRSKFEKMKYRKFRWLFAAMSLALTGVICLQVFWLAKAIDIEKKKFSEQVSGAMVAATEKMEAGEAFSMISEEMIPDIKNIPGKICDSIVMKENGKTIRIIKTPGMVPLPPKVPSGSPIVPPSPPNPPQIIENDSVIVTNDTNMTMIMHKEDRLKSAVKGAYLKFVTKTGKADERVTLKQINDALTESFRNAGITEKFSFAVKDKSTGKFEFVSDSSQLKNLASADFRTPLFPSDIAPESEDLFVLLDGHHSRIISNLWPQFLISFLFTAFLIVVFFMTFREALKQKKLGEIKNDFINNMTHELKTPIATISLAADTVMNEAVVHDPERVRQYAEVIKRENRRMNEQVEKVLELALTERNELQLEKVEIDLNGLLARVVNVMTLQVESRKGKIATDFTDAASKIMGDPFHLERVFLNLIDNAIKYSKNAPEIKVKTSIENNSIVVEISDNGIGIAEDEWKRIFERFYRVSTGNLHDVKGFGLGLNYVKTIVEKHGGRISVNSKPGKGSTFKIIFQS